MTDFEFDPFLDYAKITSEMTQDMYAAVREYEAAKNELLASPSPGAVERLLKAQDDVQGKAAAIESAILTVPVLVHVAGERQEEHMIPGDEDSPIAVVQRCQRCKSPLMGWREGLMGMTPTGPRPVDPDDDIDWWPVGAVVAKANLPSGNMAAYTIEDQRPLEVHERECVGLPNME